MSGLGQVFGSKTWSLGSSRFWWLPPSQSWGQGWGWKGRGAWKPKVSFGGLVDNWAWPNGGFNGLRRGNLARNQSLSKRPKLAGPVMSYPLRSPREAIKAQGGQFAGWPRVPRSHHGESPSMSKILDDFGSDISGTHWAWTSKSSTVQWHQTLNPPTGHCWQHQFQAKWQHQKHLETGKRAVTSLKARLQIVTPSINRLGTMNHHKYEDTQE